MEEGGTCDNLASFVDCSRRRQRPCGEMGWRLLVAGSTIVVVRPTKQMGENSEAGLRSRRVLRHYCCRVGMHRGQEGAIGYPNYCM